MLLVLQVSINVKVSLATGKSMKKCPTCPKEWRVCHNVLPYLSGLTEKVSKNLCSQEKHGNILIGSSIKIRFFIEVKSVP